MFKLGDKIRCINDEDSDGLITIGKTYIVLRYHLLEEFIYIKNDAHKEDYYLCCRFKLAEEIKKEYNIAKFMRGELK